MYNISVHIHPRLMHLSLSASVSQLLFQISFAILLVFHKSFRYILIHLYTHMTVSY